MTEATTHEPIVKNAMRCGICQSPADRYDFGFQCQANPNHMGDLNVGIFSDLTPPATTTEATRHEFITQTPEGTLCVFVGDGSTLCGQPRDAVIHTSATVEATPREYVTTKEQCEANIKGVCEGCGGELTAIETVDNSRRPTFWQGCEHCSCFRAGVERKYFEIARKLVEDRVIVPYGHMCRVEYENTPERLDYYFDSQTAGLSHTIKRIDHLLNPKSARADSYEAMREALKRCEFDFDVLITRGDLAEEPRAKETLKIIRAALADEVNKS